MSLTNGHEQAKALTKGLFKAVLGKEKEAVLLVTAFLAGGHVLIEDVPGVGKTTLASALARLSGLDYNRVQFTPDVTPSDITGFNMFDKRSGEFVFRHGAVNADIFLGDEINRASPKTQSALLECMNEGTVTVDGEMHALPKVFTVIATQNPMGFVGTYPLPEAQVDRFCMRFSMGYPTFEAEMRIAAGMTHENTLPTLTPVTDRESLAAMREEVKQVSVDEEIYKYAVTLITATRNNKYIALGASPRGSVMVVRLAKAYAYLQSRDYVLPEDIHAMFIPCINHRITLSQEAKRQFLTAEQVLEEILKETDLPRRGKGRI
ncbi:MAG: MoxR family ATPase [Clostridia bacterium]|nr:MoxR family ATPase [Clostridia bacterium]